MYIHSKIEQKIYTWKLAFVTLKDRYHMGKEETANIAKFKMEGDTKPGKPKT